MLRWLMARPSLFCFSRARKSQQQPPKRDSFFSVFCFLFPPLAINWSASSSLRIFSLGACCDRAVWDPFFADWLEDHFVWNKRRFICPYSKFSMRTTMLVPPFRIIPFGVVTKRSEINGESGPCFTLYALHPRAASTRATEMRFSARPSRSASLP